MPATSPFLNDLLGRWIARRDALRKDIALHKELLDSSQLAVQAGQRVMKERQSRELRTLERAIADFDARWEARFDLTHAWREGAADIQRQMDRLHQSMDANQWFQKAESARLFFERHLGRHAQRLSEAQQQLRQDLEKWQSAVSERWSKLAGLKQKEAGKGRAILVSRARKQEDVEFVQRERLVEESLGRSLRQARRSLQLGLGRVHKAHAIIEQRLGRALWRQPGLETLEQTLQSREVAYQELRGKILSDALTYEGCRHTFRLLQETVRTLRCVEDVYAPR